MQCLQEYVGERYLRFAGDGTRFLKGGVDSAERMMDYADFDGTFRDLSSTNRPPSPNSIANLRALKDELLRFERHMRDWREGTKWSATFGSCSFPPRSSKPIHRMKANSMLVALALMTTWCSSAQPTNYVHVAAGPLALEIHVSRTAHLFHVVDQVSQWSEFCHRQYLAWFDEGRQHGLSPEDRQLLEQHGAIRQQRGWGGGLEQTFYTPLDLDAALAQGVKQGWITDREARTERRILRHFASRVERLLAEQTPTLRRFIEQLSRQQLELAAFARQASRFVGGTNLNIPVYLMANPDKHNTGGGYNGGRLTLEIASQEDIYLTLLHEAFHAFLRTRQDLLAQTARRTPGLDVGTLSEGLAHALNPGLVRSGEADRLLAQAKGYVAQGASLKESYPRCTFFGLALRPLLKNALADEHQTLDTFLPRAVDAWLVLVELDKARRTKIEELEPD